MTQPIRPQRGLDSIHAYVPGKPIDEVKREYGLDDVIKMASNENPLGVSPKALRAMQDALPRLNHYPDGASYEFRSALATHFDVDRSQVAVGNGADDLILELSMAFLDEGDEVIVSRSSFPMYDIYTAAMRARIVKTPLTPQQGIDLDAMADAVTDRTRLIYVCNPNNPTGTIVGAREVERFLGRIPERVIIVMDEAYVEMVDSDDFPDSLAYVRSGRPNVVVLRTFSKVYGLAGIRIGYGFAHADLMATLFRIKPPFNVNVLAQAAGIAALDDGEFVARSVDENRKGREFLYEGLARLGLEYAASHTNFILVRFGPRAAGVQQALLERGVIVRPCGGYDLPEHLRISIGTPVENARFLRELEAVLADR
jgi:histidinol-phosphate aminotransferase